MISFYARTLKILERIPGLQEISFLDTHTHTRLRCNQCGLWFDPLCSNDSARANLGGQLCCSASHHLPFITPVAWVFLRHTSRPLTAFRLARVQFDLEKQHRWMTGHCKCAVCFYFVVFGGLYLWLSRFTKNKLILGTFTLNLPIEILTVLGHQ